MKAAFLPSVGFDNLEIRDLPDPTPGPGEVVLKMAAASLNYRDMLICDGGYGSRQKREELIPVSDGAGTIAAVGPGVRGVKEGDRVISHMFPDWNAGKPNPRDMARNLGGSIDGVAAEMACLPASTVYPAPAHLSDLQAAALPCAGVTAWNGVVTLGGAKIGDTVVTQGSGGVSLFALQFAKAVGARVIATTSSAEKAKRLTEMGASHVINYKENPEWGKEVREVTGKAGADVIVEVGGAGTLSESFRGISLGGTITMIGVLSGVAGELSVAPIVMQAVKMIGVAVGNRDQFEAMLRAVSQAEIVPVIETTFPLDQIKDAITHMKSGQHFGKIGITFD